MLVKCKCQKWWLCSSLPLVCWQFCSYFHLVGDIRAVRNGITGDWRECFFPTWQLGAICAIWRKSGIIRLHYLTETGKTRQFCLWKPGNVGIQQGRDKESKKAVPVPDQKGEEEGGTKLQLPRGTTEKRSEWWEGGVQAVEGAKTEDKQSKHKFDRKRVWERVKERERVREKLAKSQNKQKARTGGREEWEEGKTVKASENLSFHLAHDFCIILTNRKWVLSF